MKAFILNLAQIIEQNAKIYVSIIVGLVGCLLLLVAEAVHVQTVVTQLATQDQQLLKQVIQPLTQKYNYARYAVMILAILWSVLEYRKTKQKMAATTQT